MARRIYLALAGLLLLAGTASAQVDKCTASAATRASTEGQPASLSCDLNGNLRTASGAGSTAVTSVVPGTAATNLGKAEDGAAASGDTGVAVYGIQTASPADTAAEGDYVAPQLSGGRLWTSTVITSDVPGVGATNAGKAEDAAHSSGDTGNMPLAVRQDAVSSLATTAGDYIPLTTDANGLLQVGPDVYSPTCTASSAAAMCTIDTVGYQAIAIQMTANASANTVTFEQSNDNTTFSSVMCQLPSSFATAPAVSTTSATAFFICPIQGRYFRPRISTFVSGTTTAVVALRRSLAATFFGTGNGNANSVQGAQANGAGLGGNTFAISIQARSTTPTSTGSGNQLTPLGTQDGRIVNNPLAIPENTWNYAAATGGISNTTTAVTIQAAGSGSLRNYVDTCQISSDPLGAATEFAIRDGAAGTVLWRMKIGTAGIVNGLQIQFMPALRGTAATLTEVVTLTASITGGIFANCQGHQST